MKESEEKLLKTLIYEDYARKTLSGKQGQVVRRIKFLWTGIAASLAILVYGASVFFSQDKLVSRDKLADAVYAIPDFSLSRSEPSRVDLFREALVDEKYSQVLDSLMIKSDSDKDRVAQAHLLFKLDSMDRLEKYISTVEISNPQFSEEIEWLNFLLEFKQGRAKDQLENTASGLSERFADDAYKLLESLD